MSLKSGFMSEVKDQIKELDHPVQTSGWNPFKWGNLRVLIINEDLSFKEFSVKFPESYIIDIKKRYYVVVPKCVLRGASPTIVYYYNNPFPVEFMFTRSSLTPKDFIPVDRLNKLADEQKSIVSNVFVDAMGLKLAFQSEAMKSMYEKKGVTFKAVLIIVIVSFVLILIMLQLFGVVDVMGFLTGTSKFLTGGG